MNVSQFLRVLRRRMIVVRALEAAGMGLIVAAWISLLLALLLLSSGRDAMPLCVAALTAGAFVGAAWSLLRRPTLLHAAMETDRQMDLADLFTTAITRCDCADPWQAAVIAMAEQRCASLSPSDVMLARFGARAWGGIGLSAALVLAVGALSASPRDSRATSAEMTDAIIAPSVVATRSSDRLFPPAVLPPATPSPETKSPFVTPEQMDDVTPGVAQMTNQKVPQRSASGNGDNSAKTSVSSVPTITSPASSEALSIYKGRETAAGGRGDASVTLGTDQAATSGTGSSSTSVKPLPPWKTATWPQDRAAADRAVQDGHVADAYHDVVQRYFQPE